MNLICSKRGSDNLAIWILPKFAVNNHHNTQQNKFDFTSHQSFTSANVPWGTSVIPTYNHKNSHTSFSKCWHFVLIMLEHTLHRQLTSKCGVRTSPSVECCHKKHISISLLPLSTDELSMADKLGYSMWCHRDMTVKTAALSAFPQHAAPSAH